MKYITVAKDKEAMEALDYDPARPDQIWEYVVPDEEFTFLLTSGITDRINELCDSMIDDFEDEIISDQKCLRLILVYLKKINQTPGNIHITTVLIDMFEKALANQTAVHFFF